jgi:hypothetical protein
MGRSVQASSNVETNLGYDAVASILLAAGE